MAFSILKSNQGCKAPSNPMVPTPVSTGTGTYTYLHPNPPCDSIFRGTAKKRKPLVKKRGMNPEKRRHFEIPQSSETGTDCNSDSGGDWNSEDEDDDSSEEERVIVVQNSTSCVQTGIPVPNFPGYVLPGQSGTQFLPSQFLWTSDYQPQRVRDFSHFSGLKVDLQSEEPIDYFWLLFSDELCNLILEETNNHARVLASADLAPTSEIRKWKPLMRGELDIFLGLLYLTGQVQAPSLFHYWQNNFLYNYPQFQNAMTRNRFVLILRMLHFARNPFPGEPKPSDPLYKVQPIVDLFHKQVAEVHYPGKALCLDEPLVLCRGSLNFYHYIQHRNQKYDLKFYSLTEPNGFVLKTRIYCGSKDKELGGKGHAEKVAKHLLSDFLGVGHSVYMHSFYTGLDITEYLLNHTTYVTGMLRANRKGNPLEVINKSLKQLQVDAAYTANGICVMKWRNKQDIILMSSEYSSSMAKFRSRVDKITKKPEAVIKYSENMEANDPADQILAFYPVQRKRLRWYAKAAIHIFHVIMNNAYLLYKTNTDKKLKLLDFRDQVITSLIYKHCVPVGAVLCTRKTNSYHTPKEVPRNEKNRKMRKRCPVCKKKGLNVTSAYFCSQCPNEPGLCLDGCFAKYHNYKV